MVEGYADYQSGKKKGPNYSVILMIGSAAVLIIVAVVYSYLNSGRYLTLKLGSADPQVKEWAAAKMVSKGIQIIPDALQTAFDKSLDMETRRMAVYVLGELKLATMQAKLEKLFKTGPMEIRQEAAFALVKLGNPRIIKVLASSYRRAPKPLKISIIEALGEMGQHGTLDLLAEAATGKDEEIKKAADEALAKIKRKAR